MVTAPVNPRSPSGGASDQEDCETGTDPFDPDTDGDALGDGEELTLGTDPLNPDTDGDGLLDGAEGPVHGTDPRRRPYYWFGLQDAEHTAIRENMESRGGQAEMAFLLRVG